MKRLKISCPIKRKRFVCMRVNEWNTHILIWLQYGCWWWYCCCYCYCCYYSYYTYPFDTFGTSSNILALCTNSRYIYFHSSYSISRFATYIVVVCMHIANFFYPSVCICVRCSYKTFFYSQKKCSSALNCVL